MNCFTYARPLLLLAFLLTYLPIASAQPVPLPTASNGVAPRVTQPVDETKMAVLSGNVHPLALPDFDRGAAPDNYPFETIYLVLRRSNEQEAELQQAIANLHNPGSPSFHQWMTPTQFGSRFGPADSDVQAVTAWLSSHGLHVAGVNQARTFVKFSGTAGQLAASFHSSIHEYMVRLTMRIPPIRRCLLRCCRSLPAYPGLMTFNLIPATSEKVPRFTTRRPTRWTRRGQTHPLLAVSICFSPLLISLGNTAYLPR